MKLKIIHFLIPGLLLTGWGMQSCKDNFLDVPPKDRIVASDFFSSVNDLKTYSNGFYKWIPNDLYFRDSKSDNILPFVISDRVTGTRLVPTAKGSGGWSWTFLRTINFFLDNYKRVNDIQAEQQYGALARFFRAWFYYRKLAKFGDVPWYSHVLPAGDSALYKSRTSRKVVMDSVLSDINYAIKYLPEEVNLFSITKYTALILKARICLFGGTYRKYHNLGDDEKLLQEAVKASKTLISSNIYSLYQTGGPGDAYRNLFAMENQTTTETILARNYAKNISHNAISSQMISLTHGGWGMTQDMVNVYLMKDGSRFTDQPNYSKMGFYQVMQNRDPRLTQTTAGPDFTLKGEPVPVNLAISSTGYRIIKYLPFNKDQWHSSYNDVIVFRYAECLLIYAEAKAELGTITQHDLDISINKLRDRVGMPDLNLVWANAHSDPYLLHSYPGVDKGANKGVILEIRRERRIELFNEGFRWDDLMRWAEGEKIEQSMVGIYFPGLGAYDFNNDGQQDVYVYQGDRSGAPDGISSFINIESRNLTHGVSGHLNPFLEGGKFVSPKGYLSPIPIEDLELNPQLEQNPGWDQ